MAFQQVNVAGITPIGNPAARNLMSNIMQGMQVGAMPGQMSRQRQAQELANKIQAEQARYLPQQHAQQASAQGLQQQMMQAKLDAFPQQQEQAQRMAAARSALLGAQAQMARRQSQDPFMGKYFPGMVGQAQALEKIKQAYGEDSPFYHNAMAAHQLDMDKMQSLMNYQKSLTQTLPKRASTQTAKTMQEQEDINQGYIPGTNRAQTIPEGQQDRYKQQAGLSMLKHISDPATRQTALFAENMDKTLDMIDPEKAFVYSGAQGQLAFQLDRAKSLTGSTPKRYSDFLEQSQYLKMLGKQYRQYNKESITPTQREAIEAFLNPASVLVPKEDAIRMFNSTRDLIKSEKETFKKSFRSMDPFLSKKGKKAMSQDGLDGLQGKTVVYFTGEDGSRRRYQVPNNQVKEALKRGGTLHG